MNDWLERYPQIRRLLQQEDDELLDADQEPAGDEAPPLPYPQPRCWGDQHHWPDGALTCVCGSYRQEETWE